MGADFSEIHVQPVDNVAEVGCGDADEGLEQRVGDPAAEAVAARAAHEWLEGIHAESNLLDLEFGLGVIGAVLATPGVGIVELEFFLAEKLLVRRIAPCLEAVPVGDPDEEFPARLHDPPQFFHRAGGFWQVLQHIVHVNLLKGVIRPRPREFCEIMHDIHARKRGEIVVDPTFFDDMAAAEVEFHRVLVFNGLI